MRVLLSALLVVFLYLPTDSAAQTYQYKVRYLQVRGGTAIVTHEVKDDVLLGEMRISSSPWLSTLWTLSDSIMSQYDLKNERLIQHYKAIHEGNYHRNYLVRFQDSTLTINDKVKIQDVSGMFDLPSLLHHLSTETFKHGDTLSYLLWDGRSYGELTLKVEKTGKASLRHPFPTKGWRLVPLTSTEKSRQHQINLTLFFSSEIPRIPTKIHINTKYGEIVMKLES